MFSSILKCHIPIFHKKRPQANPQMFWLFPELPQTITPPHTEIKCSLFFNIAVYHHYFLQIFFLLNSYLQQNNILMRKRKFLFTAANVNPVQRRCAIHANMALIYTTTFRVQPQVQAFQAKQMRTDSILALITHLLYHMSTLCPVARQLPIHGQHIPTHIHQTVSNR